MTYPVKCECGKTQRVEGTLAGSVLPCPCGQSIQVPSLSQLKSSVGEAALSAEVRIEQMIRLGMLPEEKRCLMCGLYTEDVQHVWTVCERIEVQEPAIRNWWAHVLLILFVGLFFYVFILLYLFRRYEEKAHGRDVRLRLPLRVCRECDDDLDDPAILRNVVMKVPHYEELLEKYPDAELSVRAKKKR
jgi:hypothetical protein